MARHPTDPEETALRFTNARRWRAWREWPGVMGLATGVALWIFMATGVVAPLADALARLRLAEVVPAQASRNPAGALPAEEACACSCPAPVAPGPARQRTSAQAAAGQAISSRQALSSTASISTAM